MRGGPRGWIAIVLVVPASASAAPGQGSQSDPVVIDALPWFQRGDTAGAASDAIDAYDCDAALDESGPEKIHRFELPADARVTAWLEGDDGVVDNDVHLLHDLVLDGTTAQQCAARGHTIAEADMAAGTHYVVVDSWNGEAQSGPYVLRIWAVGEEWTEVPVGEGVIWRARRYADDDGDQAVHAIEADLGVEGVSLEVVDPDGCQTTGAAAEAHAVRPVAAVNSSFFSFDGVCTSNVLMKQAGTVLATGSGQAFGLTRGGEGMVATVGGGDWPEAWTAQAGRGLLVDGGVPTQGAAAWGDQGMSADFQGPHPRTIAGYREDGTVVLGTVDGRHTNASGKSLDALASWAAEDLGCTGAVNWDGGGSTTMWVADMTPNGVVNYPSDAGGETTDHSGSRPSGGSVFVHANPYNWAPRFQSEPVVATAVGETYAYDADAIDLNVDDVVAYSIVDGPDGLEIDGATGDVTFAPTVESPPSATVTILASDGRGGDTEQTFMLAIEGGMGSGDDESESGSGDEEAGSGDPSEGGDDDTGPPGDTTGMDASTDTDDAARGGGEVGGCGCGTAPAAAPWLVLLPWLRRRRA
jgi:hypothetical protein